MSTWRKVAAVGSALAVLILAGCSSGDDEPDDGASSTTSDTSDDSSSSPDPTAPVQSPNSPDPGVQTGPVSEMPTPRGGNQASVLDPLPGSAKPGCVDVGDEQTVRSGEVASGDYVQVRQTLGSGSSGRVPVFFIPQNAKGVRSVTVEVTDPDGKTTSVTSNNRGSANDWRYVSAMLPLRAGGTWEIRATMNDQVGCFRVNLS